MTFFLGTLGLTEISDETIARIRQQTAALGIGGSIALDREHFKHLTSAAATTLQAADSESRLVERSIPSYVCPCGALEVPVGAVEFLKGKTFFVDASGVHCRRCGNLAHQKSITKYFLLFKEETVQFFKRTVDVVPSFYKKEIENLLEHIYTEGVPVSKSRDTGAVYRNISVDIEFVLAHTGALLHEHTTLVATNHVLRQLILTSLVDIESGTRTIHQLLVLPYLIHPGDKEKWSLNKLFANGHDARTIRFMLASSLRWDQKDTPLEDGVVRSEYLRLSKFFQLINAHQPATCPPLEEIVAHINHHECSRGLDEVFKQRGFDYTTLYGI